MLIVIFVVYVMIWNHPIETTIEKLVVWSSRYRCNLTVWGEVYHGYLESYFQSWLSSCVLCFFWLENTPGTQGINLFGWWQLKYFFNFHPETWGNDPILTFIFFKWVETTNQYIFVLRVKDPKNTSCTCRDHRNTWHLVYKSEKRWERKTTIIIPRWWFTIATQQRHHIYRKKTGCQ